jgi:SAM-dependent methyltransferase
MDNRHFDPRRYPALPVREGHARWAATCEGVVQDETDLRLLERVSAVDRPGTDRALDLACGTGRTTARLRTRGVGPIDGVEPAPEMSARAGLRGAHDRLVLADARDTGLPAAIHDLIVESLADEHLPRASARSTARLARPGATFVPGGLHPHLLTDGVPTRVERRDGAGPVAIETRVHLLGDHARAADRSVAEMEEGVVDDAWVAKKPKRERLRHHPVSSRIVWRRVAAKG